MQKTTADFLESIAIENGAQGLYSAARQVESLVANESDRALAGALLLMRWTLMGIARDLESDPTPSVWDLRKVQLDALVVLVRNRDASSFANFASFPV